MLKQFILGTVLASSFLFAGCTQQGQVSAPSAGHASSVAAPAEMPLMLYNAFTAKSIDTGHPSGVLTKSFGVSDPIFVGAVIHGKAASAVVKVEWSLVGGPVLGSEEVTIPVADAAVATLNLSKGAPLGVGSYKAIVLLNGKPEWELEFRVGA